MSKLDDILGEYGAERAQAYKSTNISHSSLHLYSKVAEGLKTEAKQQIKDLMIELVNDLNGGDWRKPINSDDLRQEIEEL